MNPKSFASPSSFTQPECPSCGSNNVLSSPQAEEFQYGDKADLVSLSAQIIVHHCESCGLSFTTEDASEARHNAVCKHLGVLAPKEILAVRERYNMSQADFSDLSKLGKASLNRWEGGLLVQNQANDNLLYLLSFEDNVRRLRERYRSREKVDELINNVIPFRPKFRALPSSDVERLNREAVLFELFPETRETRELCM